MKTRVQVPKLEAVRAAAVRIAPYVRRTPLLPGAGITYKAEFEQVTGSFKPRGAFNAALQLDDAARSRGLVAVSGGNHGLAVAHVGRRLGIRATVLMPKTTPAWLVERAQADGAEVLLFDTIALAFAEMQSRTAAGQTPLHPFDDEHVMAGQGTIGLELLEQIPDLHTLVVSIGGGGLIAGIASVIKTLAPHVRVYGVETVGADAMRKALDAGHPVQLPAITSIARTLGAPIVSDATLAAVQTLVDGVVSLPDAEAVRSLVQLRDTLGVTVEPAASCCHAALRLGLIPAAPSGTTAVLLCGANVDREEIEGWRRTFGV
ncbi:MAG: pyridoxal-phosphate dependent enzyme [Candidatus Eremiobacteraeota bacterium]|nr:pyridoxal-phosphate dependent enzyme [Candidatus Eremiobacteraeota bacterium]MBV8281521.1 pyridoxal-phosphate dependent enzyme [Candidatus Eremiobacteraeota bacterium]